MIDIVKELLNLMNTYGTYAVFAVLFLFLYVRSNNDHLKLIIEIKDEDNKHKIEQVGAIKDLKSCMEKVEVGIRNDIEKSCLKNEVCTSELSSKMDAIHIVLSRTKGD